MSKSTSSPFPFFVIRLPYKPISQLLTSMAGSDRESSVELLRTLMTDPWTQEAIFLASPALYETWKTIRGRALDQYPDVVNSLWRYIFRSYARSTPYGLFSGMGVGELAQHSQHDFQESSWYATTRPDCTVLEALSRSVERNLHYRQQLQFSLNNSLYEVLGEYRFSEFSDEKDANGDKKASLTSHPITEELTILVTYLNQVRRATLGQLAGLFDPSDKAEVVPFLNELIDSRFLISNLALPVTGQEMSQYLLAQLAQLSPLPVEYTILEATTEEPNASLYTQSETLKKALLDEGVITDTVASLLHTDLYFTPAQLTLSRSVLQVLSRQFSELIDLLSFERDSPLRPFANRFTDRFERREMELLVALDSEVGVGFTNETLSLYPLLGELGFSETGSSIQKPDRLTEFREVLYSRFLLSGQIEVELLDQDLRTYTAIDTAPPLPSSWYLHGELYKGTPTGQPSSHQPLEEPFRFALNAAVATSPAVLLGRFCHGHDELRKQVEAMCHWEQSQDPSALLAEVVHLPMNPVRAGNVVARPILRTYEIPYLTPSALEPERTIPLSDILVSVTEAGLVSLRSKSTGQRILPRLSSAHNPALGDEIYQFLVAVQYQEYDALGWSWRALSQMAILPRLVYKNIIITPAQWNIRKGHLPTDSPLTVERLTAFYRLPRFVLLVESDNKLLLDLSFGPAQTVLLIELEKHGQLTLKEWLGETHPLWVTNGADAYVSEVIIPMKTIRPVPANSLEPNDTVAGQVRSSSTTIGAHYPGSQWLYYKVYLHESLSDLLLMDVLKPFGQKAIQRKWIQDFFYVRYQDPESHLRIRFRVNDRKFIGRIITEWLNKLQPYVDNQMIHKVQLDTYFPELERYTPALMSVCESFFSSDSLFVLNWLSQATKTPTEEDQYKFALISAQRLLSDLAIPLVDRVRICRHLQASFLKEQGNTKYIRQQLNSFYRDQHTGFFSESSFLTKLADERSEQTRPLCAAMLTYFSQPDRLPLFDSFIASLLHMSMNRIFRGQQRRHELIVYHFLVRFYETQEARARSVD